MIDLFSTYFDPKDKARRAEFDVCLKKNVENNFISRIVLFIDDDSEPTINSDKITIIKIDSRPTYQDWISKSRELYDGSLSLFANTDIYFDDTINDLKRTLSGKQDFLALSRWEVVQGKTHMHSSPHWSQDVWGISDPTAIDEKLISSLDFSIGVPRCDNKIAYAFAIRGWSIYNPCSLVKSYHLHETQLRSYHKMLDTTIVGGVAYVHPSKQLNEASLVDIDIWVINGRNLGAPKLNKSIERWLAEGEAKTVDDKENAPPQPTQIEPAASLPVLNLLPSKKTKSKERERQIEGSSNVLELLSNGERVQNHSLGYEIWRYDDQHYARHGYGTSDMTVLDAFLQDQVKDVSVYCIPPILRAHLPLITTRPASPASPDDVNFWQYPCSTEKQALDNHFKLKPGDNIDITHQIANVYAALPWATYIDKNKFDEDVLKKVRTHLALFRKIAENAGFKLRVHTVCQHIRWKNIISICDDIGIEVLHISHNEVRAEDEIKQVSSHIRVRSWPLIAPNIEVAERRTDLIIGKPPREKKYLASFIGAHMKHYRSDIRLRIKEAAEKSHLDNILVKVNTEWHFEKIVYTEQVKFQALSQEETKGDLEKIKNYNEVLSDSVFSLCPEGAGPNTLRFWESLAIGSIPVIFDKKWLPPRVKSVRNIQDIAVIIDEEDHDFLTTLAQIPQDSKDQMSRKCIEAYNDFRAMRCF